MIVRRAFRLFLLGVMAWALLPAGAAAAAERRTAIVAAVEKVSPAVVNIRTEKLVRWRRDSFSTFFQDPFFERFFRDFFEPRQRKYQQHSLGSGVIFDSEGHILTNWHVIAQASRITVNLADERTFEAELVGSDPSSDLAVLDIISKAPLPYVEMGSSDDLMIGETVIAIGNPFGFSHSVTTGIISALRRSFRTEDQVFNDFIQLDASINPGNSGGPLLDINGRLIGINTAIYNGAQGIGFAIPISRARRIVDDLLRFGEVHPAWLGLQVQPLTEEIAKQFGASSATGVLVNQVDNDGPAARAGIKRGDIITRVDQQRITDVLSFESSLEQFTANDRVPLGVFQQGETRTIVVQSEGLSLRKTLERAERLLGLAVEEVTLRSRTRYRLVADEGVVITGLVRNGLAHRVGLAPGDVILQINRQAVGKISDFQRAIIRLRRNSSVLFIVQRGLERYRLMVEL
ncbi:MAG: Do family serine endopeptidase [Candidatus Tectomicrobia bacterium]|nr:Do family serine endopeptidase [Candidatus Tectomicrobia bacterium]